MIEQYDDSDRRKNTLDKPGFHDNGRLFYSLMFQEMMQWWNSKQLSFEVFLPKYLEKTWAKIYDKEWEEYDKGDQYTCSHVEKIEERSNKSS